MWSVTCLKHSYEARQPNSQAGLDHALFLPNILACMLMRSCFFKLVSFWYPAGSALASFPHIPFLLFCINEQDKGWLVQTEILGNRLNGPPSHTTWTSVLSLGPGSVVAGKSKKTGWDWRGGKGTTLPSCQTTVRLDCDFTCTCFSATLLFLRKNGDYS